MDLLSASFTRILSLHSQLDLVEIHIGKLYGSLNPMTFLDGIQLFSGPVMASPPTRGDFENYIVRLHLVQRQIDEIIESFQLAVQLNRTLHNVSVEKVPGQIEGKIFDDPIQSPYYRPFNNTLENSLIPENDRVDLRNRGRQAVGSYINAFRKVKNYIIDEYMPQTRKSFGIMAWDPTHNYYRACLRWHLSFDMTPEEVHTVGIKEVERISEDMNQIVKKLGFTGSVKEFFDSLLNDHRFYSNDSELILELYRKTVFERINPHLSSFFKDIPNVPLMVEKTAYDGLGGGYSSASEDSPGVFSINLFRPLEVPFFEMMALSLHEANPGHHMQHSYSMYASLPDFRKNSVFSFYNVPNWFPFYSAYQEGWALYSEYLGEEMGLYKDNYEMMGRYSYEILRAVRLVVDTGIHYYGWSRDRAIDYMINYTGMGPGSAANEIDRYITWPGQACAYKLGEIKIKDLRKMAELQLGSKFDIREFHSVILENGGMPMSVLETLVTSWIQEKKISATAGKKNKPPLHNLDVNVYSSR
ncbi:hypothetical protein CHS0354_015218 [Potamilus streckersoni]|uniref:DUF885 domain-containing protein n=1 Tax=Potamilus streckersoni TaxID=2493646 RepID=A0AAE0SD55_9BIVA|nr:hypothetical protein CHS0354_015218 [Potamilus streckersoni]